MKYTYVYKYRKQIPKTVYSPISKKFTLGNTESAELMRPETDSSGSRKTKGGRGVGSEISVGLTACCCGKGDGSEGVETVGTWLHCSWSVCLA